MTLAQTSRLDDLEVEICAIEKYVTDPLTGLRVAKATNNAESVTTERIKALLEDYS